ncbi:MAG: DUF6650 family protein, partial [Chloroflexota bacterium]
SKLDVDVARRLLTFIEDRRVLFDPTNVEVPSYAARSVQDIRQRLTEALADVDRDGPLGQSLLAMRAACRKFLDATRGIDMDTPFPPRPWACSVAVRNWCSSLPWVSCGASSASTSPRLPSGTGLTWKSSLLPFFPRHRAMTSATSLAPHADCRVPVPANALRAHRPLPHPPLAICEIGTLTFDQVSYDATSDVL